MMAETKERPILFSPPMIRAILAGEKTQTRRVVKPQPPAECSIHYMLGAESWLPVSERSPLRHHWEAWGGQLFDERPEGHLCGSHTVRCPYGAPGEMLWVRESHQRFDKGSCDQHVWYTAGLNDNAYVARTRPEIDQDAPWPRDAAGPAGGAVYGVPSIHMPRWASRIALEIVSVRVERLREIDEADALCEGVREPSLGDDLTFFSHGGAGKIPRSAAPPLLLWEFLWRGINGDASWEANPFVWVVEFKRVQA